MPATEALHRLVQRTCTQVTLLQLVDMICLSSMVNMQIALQRYAFYLLNILQCYQENCNMTSMIAHLFINFNVSTLLT